jgi:hypothetical protein
MFKNPRFPHTQIPFLSILIPEEELVYYDKPLCVLFRDRFGRLYLGHYLDHSNEQHEFWYIVPIDRKTLPRLLSGQISLKSVLTEVIEEFRLVGRLSSRSEDEFVFDHFIQWPDVGSLEEYLPNSNFVFFEDEFEEFLSNSLEPIIEYAKKRFAEVIYLRLVGRGLLPTLFPVGQLAEIGQIVQRLITNLALFNTDPDHFGKRGVGRQSIERASELALTGVVGGSVQLRLESIREPELINEMDPVYNGIRIFTELIGTADSSDICDRLSNYPPRIRSNYLAYATSLHKAKAGANIKWGSPRAQQEWESIWTPENVEEIIKEVGKLSIAEDTTFDATGVFVEGSMNTGRFKFFDISNNRSLTGRLAQEVIREVITLSRRDSGAVLYDVVINEVVSTTSANSTSYEYTFLEVEERN